MTHAEILAELPLLSASEREDLMERLFKLQEQDILTGKSSLQDWEKQALDEAWEEYEKDPNAGRPWREVMAELRGLKTR